MIKLKQKFIVLVQLIKWNQKFGYYRYPLAKIIFINSLPPDQRKLDITDGINY